MASVYSNAVLNLAVIGSSEHDLCFTSRQPLKEMPCILSSESLQIKGNNEYLLYVKAADPTPRQGPPLLLRGWVFQERYLCRRMVYLGAKRITWECLETTLDESWYFQVSLPKLYRRTEFFECMLPSPTKSTVAQWLKQIPPLVKRFRDASDPDAQDKFLEGWINMVSLYKSTDLTRETDRLAAFSGIAQVVASENNLDYVAGMWIGEGLLVLKQLLWRCLERSHKTPFLGAPSWSWPSLHGELEFSWTSIRKDADRWVSCAEVVKVQKTPPIHPNPVFGEVQSALLELRGRLVPVEYRGGIFYFLKLSDQPHPKSSGMYKDRLSYYDQPEVLWAFVLFCAPKVYSRPNPLPDQDTFGLILEQVGDEVGKLFKRFGTFKLEWGGELWLEWLQLPIETLRIC